MVNPLGIFYSFLERDSGLRRGDYNEANLSVNQKSLDNASNLINNSSCLWKIKSDGSVNPISAAEEVSSKLEKELLSGESSQFTVFFRDPFEFSGQYSIRYAIRAGEDTIHGVYKGDKIPEEVLYLADNVKLGNLT